MQHYLAETDILNWTHPDVLQLAQQLAGDDHNVTAIAKRCFEWVRDEIKHSYDYRMNPLTCAASEVLQHGTGFCYAKSHLLAALLRANRIPVGLCYQRLSLNDDGAPFCLHGLVVVFLPEIGWYRIDPRGNKPGVNAQFTPPREQLAFSVKFDGEALFQEIWPEPLPLIVRFLQQQIPVEEAWEQLPDIEILPNHPV